MTDTSISLNKYISSTGVCSRREADKWIDAGRVLLNGVVAVKGNRVEPNDEVLVDGQSVKPKAEPLYIALNKPPGITCTTELDDPDNIIDYINHPKRIFPIGRLDKPSSGLILLTNDGDIVNRILRVENNHEKEYVVTVNQPITDEFIHTLANGIPMLDTVTNKCKVQKLKKNIFKIVLTQGLNRQIRRMCEYCDYKVVTLKRVRVMHINIDNLKKGEWRYLTEEEMGDMWKALEGSKG